MHADLLQLLALISNPLTLAGVVLIVGFLVERLASGNNALAQFLCRLASFAGFTAMLSTALVSPFKPTAAMDVTITYLVISAFKIMWWLAAAWLLSGFVRSVLIFKRQPEETRFLQDVCAGAIYLVALLGIVADVFDLPISGLLAASGVIAIVLGLALQNTLGDVFSGVVLNLSKPYRPGDWLILDAGQPGALMGRVIDTTWRATQLLTRQNDIVVLPNSMISRAQLVNASAPTTAHGVIVIVRIDPTNAPATMVSVLETALLGCIRILPRPHATVMVRSLDAVALECELTFFIGDIDNLEVAQNEVFDRVYRYCASAGFRLAPPAASSLVLPPRGAPMEPGDAPRRRLERLPIFLPLSSEERSLLAPKMRRLSYNAGEVLLEQGIVSSALYILGSGVLAAFQHHEDTDAEILRYAPGDCFGQTSVLTGAPTLFKVKALTYAVVYEIAKDDLAPILKARPAIAAELGHIMANRQAAGKDRLTELDDLDPHSVSLAERLTDHVRTLFGLST